MIIQHIHFQGDEMEKETDIFSLPQRHSTRLPNHNYRWSASYFVTIRANHHEPVFEMPELHQIVQEQWDALPTRFAHVQLDEFVIMPDHIHGILHFQTSDTASPSLGRVIGAYKSLTSVLWFRYVKEHNVFWKGVLWQRSFHDHILRDANDLEQKRQYIRNNPVRWKESNPYT